MSSLALVLSAMLQLPDIPISDNARLVVGALICLGIIGIMVQAYLPQSKNGLALPPSPSTWRLQGHFLPHRKSFVTIAGWIDEYGPLITVRSGLKKSVIIGRYKAAMDIMEHQGAALADRPRKIAAGEIFSGGLGLTLTPFGEKFRQKRRALHTHLQPKAAEVYQPLLMSHVKNLVLDILNDPYNFQNHAISYSATTIMKIAYGSTIPTNATDPLVGEMYQLMKLVSSILRPDSYHLVDSFPWLKHLPWYGRELKRGFQRSKRLHIGQMNRVKEQLQSKADIGPSFMRYMLENSELHGLTVDETAFLGGAFFGAGSDTTTLSMCIVLLAAANFPEEQAKVQAELDVVVGRHRAPTFADQQSLTRLHAFISEAVRWRPVAPNGLAHRTTKDEKYCIPAGTTVFGNHWAICRDPEVFPEPDTFKPQRWIDDKGRLRDDLNNFLYGFGRRICPGQHVANRSMFISSVLILWAFRLTLDPTQPLDDTGFMNSEKTHRPCTIKFELRIPEEELRRMMKNYPEEVVSVDEIDRH
ncbi:cytochrome P450 [Suillus clintonianus]|uniref:cytochrome P450 n=1 Tax=Suillus clintonianus TaxID=1904413 RepID=UPI001B880516|nr:cytochrome P450 [Suillus clintonianus]KAG2141067.1 cytochrome P450 [Suillus clintonianus]